MANHSEWLELVTQVVTVVASGGHFLRHPVEACVIIRATTKLLSQYIREQNSGI